MGKKSSKRRKQTEAAAQSRQVQPRCPYCGTIDSEKSALSLMDQLFRSHAELSAALRLAGRQILQFEQHGDESLERIRKVLRRAENVRKMLQSPNESPEGLKNVEQDKLEADAPAPAPEHSPDKAVNEAQVRKSVRRKPVHPRQRSLRIIRFPIG